MLIFQNAVFLHVPKTGGTWVREAARAGGATFSEYLVDGDQHGDLSHCPYPNRFKFAFVRHPCAVYSSYWRFKMRHGWDWRNPFDHDCALDSFTDFVRRVLDRYPGWCTQTFEDYVGPVTKTIEFIGRYERLADDLVLALRQAGEPFDEALLRRTPPANVSTWPVRELVWSPDLVAEVMHVEAGAVQRFGYTLSEWQAS